MEAFLSLAVAAVGIACLVIAVTFRMRTYKHAEPLVTSAARELTGLINRTAQDLRRRSDEIRATVDRSSKHAQASINSAEENLKRTGQRLEASLSTAKAEVNQARRDIVEIRKSIELLRAEETKAQQAASALSREILQLQESMRELTDSRGADRREADALRRRVYEFRASIDGVAGRLTTVVSSVRELDGRINVSEQELDRMGDFGQMAGQRLIGALRKVSRLDLDMRQVNLYVRGWLDRELSLRIDDGEVGIVDGALSPDPSIAQIVWARCEALWQALPAKLLFRYPAASPSASFYLHWDTRTGGSLSERMSALFQDCQAHASGDVGGLRELQTLLVVMYNGQPATLRVGRVVITRVPEGLFAGVLPENHLANIPDKMSLSPEAWAEKLHELDHNCVVDLTAWADAYAA